MVKRFLFLVFFIVCVLGISCSSSSKTDGGPVDEVKGIWDTLKNSTNSNISDSEIQSIILDLSSNSSAIKMYQGGGNLEIKTLDEQELKEYSFIYMLGGLSIEGVSAEDYFNMMKLQASDDDGKTFNEKNGYELDKVEKYKVNSKSDSKIKFSYHKRIDVSDTDFVDYMYDGIANFIKVSDELYVVINVLDKKGPQKDSSTVSSLYSISVINGASPVSVYLGMKQKARNSDNHDRSIKNMKEFFKDDAKRSYNNAKNYVKIKK